MPQTRQPLTGWDGLLDPKTGHLRRPVPVDWLIVPKGVELRRGVLRFADWRRPASDYVRPPTGLLERFVGLTTENAIWRFAQRFGPLGLWEPGLSERDDPDPNQRDEPIADPQPLEIRRAQQESVLGWRRYRWEFSALLALAVAVREKESPNGELFKEFQRLGVVEAYPTLGSVWGKNVKAPSFVEAFSAADVSGRLRMTKEFLHSRTRTFVRWCGLRPAVTFTSTGPEFVFQDTTANSFSFGLSLFGALTVQLLAAATGAGFAVCSACGLVFVPERRHPAFGKRRYCRACGRRAALRDAKADYRAKLRRLGVRTLRASRRRGRRT